MPATGGHRRERRTLLGTTFFLPPPAPAGPGGAPAAGRRAPSPRLGRALPTFAVLLLATVLLQAAGGAYRTDLVGYPDEAAHYVSGLLVRDFLLSPSAWASPWRFAQDFYDHYPKVAIGHWPPFFYLVQALWTAPFSADRASVLMLMAGVAAATATALHGFLAREFGRPAALAGALMFLAMPLAQQYARMVMAEFLVCLLALLAALSYARYLESGGVRDSLLFSLLAALAIMTKPNGLALAFLPPLAVLASGRLALARRPSFWLPAPLVGLACGPWYVLTLGMALEGWAPGAASLPPAPAGDAPAAPPAAVPDQGLGAAVEALASAAGRLDGDLAARNLAHVAGLLGPALFLLVVVGLLSRVARPWRRRGVGPGWAALAALLAGFWLFHSFVAPVGEPRHALLSAPAAVAFAVAGADRLRRLLAARGLRRGAAALPAGALLLFLAHAFPAKPKPWSGAIDVAAAITADPGLAGARVLVSSETDGEGAVIAELAMREDRPARRILRASKILSSSTWDGANYRSRFSTPDEVRAFLREAGVDVVVVDGKRSRPGLAHHDLLREALAGGPGRWLPVEIAPTGGRPVRYEVFRSRRRADGSPAVGGGLPGDGPPATERGPLPRGDAPRPGRPAEDPAEGVRR